MNDEKLKRVGTIAGWVVAVPLIYFLAAPLLLLLFLFLVEHAPNSDVLLEPVPTVLTPANYLYESSDLYKTYCEWFDGI